MARRFSEQQREEVASFVRALCELGGFATQREFADAIGMHPTGMSKALNAQLVPDGLHIVRMIRAAAERAGVAPLEAAVRSLRPLSDAEQGAWRDQALAEILRLLQEGEGASRSGRRRAR